MSEQESNISAAVSVTEKVIKKKSLEINKPCSLSGKPINMVTEQVDIGISNSEKKEVISIVGIKDEMDFIEKYIDSKDHSYSAMKDIDSELTNKLVENVVSALIEKHTELGEKGPGKFSLSNKVLTSFIEWNTTISSNIKFDEDKKVELSNISDKLLNAFVAENKDVIEEFYGKDCSKEELKDLYVKAELLSVIAWYVENPISEVIELHEKGSEGISKKYSGYTSLVQKISAEDVASDKTQEKLSKNVASINVEYNLAYISLAYLVATYDEFIVKSIESKIKKYASNYAEDKVKSLCGEDDKVPFSNKSVVADLYKLAKSVKNNPKVSTRLLTLLNKKDDLRELVKDDKKLEEKLEEKIADKTKWPEAVDVNVFAREYTAYKLESDRYHSDLQTELKIAKELQSLSKRFVVCGSAADISKTEGLVDNMVISLQKKFKEYTTFFLEQFKANKDVAHDNTFCGREVIVHKKSTTIYPLYDNRIVYNLKPIVDDSIKKVKVTKVVKNDDGEDVEEVEEVDFVPTYGYYMRKLYRNTLKSYKFAFASCEKEFVVLFEHITRDTVNFYTTLAINSHSDFSKKEIYDIDFERLSNCYSKASADKLDTFIKKLTSYSTKGVTKEKDLPDTIPFVVDLYESFEPNMKPQSVYKPCSLYNLHCPFASLDLLQHNRDSRDSFKTELKKHEDAAALAEELSKDEEDENGEAPVKKTKKRLTEPKLEKIYRTYYKNSAPKTGNKNTVNFLSDLAMAISYIVSLRLVWLTKVITFTSAEDEKAYHGTKERKEYVASVINKQIDAVSGSQASNDVFKSCVASITKELKNSALTKNAGDVEKAIKDDVRVLHTESSKIIEAQSAALNAENNRTTKRAAPKEVAWISSKEKKLLGNPAFISNFVLDKVLDKKLGSESQNLLISKLERLHSFAEQLSSESREPVDVNIEEDIGLVWSYPVTPYTNNNSIGIINTTLQRTLYTIIQGCLTSQFYNNDSKKKSVIGSDVFNAVLNLYRGNEIW